MCTNADVKCQTCKPLVMYECENCTTFYEVFNNICSPTCKFYDQNAFLCKENDLLKIKTCNLGYYLDEELNKCFLECPKECS